jgi:hypothetical protein
MPPQPMKLNYDQDFGVADTGDRFLMNVQPVVPISISEDWNLISRTIYWAKSTDSGPEGFGLRFAVTLLFPK